MDKMPDELLETIKMLLELDGTTVYDKKIGFNYSVAVSRIKKEGVTERTAEDEDYNLFLFCVAVQIRSLLRLGESSDSLKKDYATFVEILRSTNAKT